MRVEDYIVEESTTIIDTMKVINDGAQAIAFICDNQKLLGAVSDGDIRRYIISNGKLSEPISSIANYKPIYVYVDEEVDCQEIMHRKGIQALPIIDRNGRLCDIEFKNQILMNKYANLSLPVVIMAGGKGTRLMPYTQILPKPLIPIGEKTITEHIMNRFQKYGCTHFDIIVNYKRNFIKAYFQEKKDCSDICFVDEPEFWGTAGGLKLLAGKYSNSFFVTNCDILVDADYEALLQQHRSQGNIITLVCAKKKVVIPYGTITLSNEYEVKDLVEKPEFEFITNTGLYILEPAFLDMIPDRTFIHITDVIHNCIRDKHKVGAFLIDEHDWLDMGQLEELERMKHRMETNK